MKWGGWFVLFLELSASGVVLKDETGKQIELSKAPHRVVTLAPSLAELSAALLGDEHSRVVGVSDYTDYPEVFKTRESIGSYARFNIEKILSLRPDLVLATKDGNAPDQVEHLRELGVKVVVVSTLSLQEIERSVELVANALFKKEEGVQLLSKLKQGLSAFRERGKRRKLNYRVLLQLDDQPIVTVGQRAFLHELLTLIGVQNVYSELNQSYPRPSREDVISRDPDFIVLLALGGKTSVFEQMKERWSAFSRMKAVQSKRVQVLNADGLVRPSLRMLDGLSQLENTIFGESS